eukprot:TRINITY_DN2098_c0_g1_i2.p1 TRINITY_DN2098_c0_g1~~TRINITY_DN2098_c0_g1_i2.p1  ORF type:complete len:180 (-),score=11.70 TRINITY_DN2098_c0_g1_i2:97-636(-)
MTFRTYLHETAQVGKTALCRRLVANVFMPTYDGPTVETETYVKHVKIEQVPYAIEVYDTSGLDAWQECRDLYLEASDAFIVVYDSHCYQSFEQATKDVSHLHEIMKTVNQREDPGRVSHPIVLVANKDDLNTSREVSRVEGSTLAIQIDAYWIETSVKLSTNVMQLFCGLAHQTVLQRQ